VGVSRLLDVYAVLAEDCAQAIVHPILWDRRVLLAIPQVAAIGGSWMAERKLVAEKAWDKITALTAETMKVISAAQTKS